MIRKEGIQYSNFETFNEIVETYKQFMKDNTYIKLCEVLKDKFEDYKWLKSLGNGETDPPYSCSVCEKSFVDEECEYKCKNCFEDYHSCLGRCYEGRIKWFHYKREEVMVFLKPFKNELPIETYKRMIYHSLMIIGKVFDVQLEEGFNPTISYPIWNDDCFLSIQRAPTSVIQLLEQSVIETKNLLEIKPKVKLFGKICNQRRDVGFFSDVIEGYKYSGQTAVSKGLTDGLKKILVEINRLVDENFNSILINRYNDGKDIIGAHSDDERSLSSSGVVSISYGAERIFRIRDKTTKKIVKDVLLKSGDICIMGGNFQKQYTHELPTMSKVSEKRYSLTFRKHNENYETN